VYGAEAVRSSLLAAFLPLTPFNSMAYKDLTRAGPRSCYQEFKAKEADMVWIAAIAMAAVGGFWVKVRRERKAKRSNT
jgi:hypothetical protein